MPEYVIAHLHRRQLSRSENIRILKKEESKIILNLETGLMLWHCPADSTMESVVKSLMTAIRSPGDQDKAAHTDNVEVSMSGSEAVLGYDAMDVDDMSEVIPGSRLASA